MTPTDRYVDEWAAYLLGAILTLVWKWARYCYFSRPRPWRASTVVWFFEDSKENYVSWVTTFAIVWAAGVAYLGRVEWMLTSFLSDIPIHQAFAFLLGSLAELLAPATIKWIISKLPVPPQ